MIAVACGKGGVGKSSLTANLAVAFSQLGKRVGMLDADIYGHSIPHILGIHQKPVAVDEMIVPPVKDGLKLMSIGFFLDDNEPVMWRGPMLHRALEQFLTDVHWGEIDTLVVDMPPGTGDVSISLGQLLPRAEVVVVTTPQKLAQDVASRAARMAQKTNMRLLGVIENMTGEVFGSGGGEALAGELDVPLLGQVPLDPLLREQGTPASRSSPRIPTRRRRRRSPRSPRRSRRAACRPASSRRCRSSADGRHEHRRGRARSYGSRAERSTATCACSSHDDATWHPAPKARGSRARTPTTSSERCSGAPARTACARAR